MTARSIQRLFCFTCLLAVLAGVRPGWAADVPPLVLGVFPYVTAKQIVETYRPVVNALEKQLQRRVMIYTARDFKTFSERTRQGQYDILLTAPHLAWLARQDAGYRPFLKYAQPVQGLLMVKADSPFFSPHALRGHTLATANALAVVVLATQAQLATLGLQHTVDYQTMDAVTHTNAAMQVLQGHAEGAILARQAYKMMRPELRDQLRVLAETPPLPGLMYLAHPRLSDPETVAIQHALQRFTTAQDAASRSHRHIHGDIVSVDGSELPGIRPYALLVQELLRGAP